MRISSDDRSPVNAAPVFCRLSINDGRIDFIVRDYVKYWQDGPAMGTGQNGGLAVFDDGRPPRCFCQTVHIEARFYWTWCRETQVWELRDETAYVKYEGPQRQIPCDQMPPR